MPKKGEKEQVQKGKERKVLILTYFNRYLRYGNIFKHMRYILGYDQSSFCFSAHAEVVIDLQKR